MKQYHKGPLVFTRGNVSETADEGSSDDDTSVTWGIYKKQVFDLTDYLYTLNYKASVPFNLYYYFCTILLG